MIVPAVALNIEAKRLVEVALVEVESIDTRLVIPPFRALRLVDEATEAKKLVEVALIAKRLVVEARDEKKLVVVALVMVARVPIRLVIVPFVAVRVEAKSVVEVAFVEVDLVNTPVLGVVAPIGVLSITPPLMVKLSATRESANVPDQPMVN